MELSIEQKIEKVRDAVWGLARPMERPEYMPLHPIAVFDDYVIICDKDEKYWKASYEQDDEGKATISQQSTWQEVAREWVVKSVDADALRAVLLLPQSTPQIKSLQTKAKELLTAQNDGADQLLSFGSEVKALGAGKLGGFLVRFTDENKPDLTGDFFTSKTDFDFTTGEKATVYYNHGLDSTLKKRKLGQAMLTVQDAGIWAETQLSLRDEYEKRIYAMAEAGKLGWSSGTLPNLVEREQVGKAYWIKSWPLGKDASLTPTPAAGLVATSVMTIKSWADATEGLQVDWTKDVGDTSGTNTKAENSNGNGQSSLWSKFKRGVTKMADERTEQEIFQEQFNKALSTWKVKAIDEPMSAQSTKLDSLSGSVDRLLKLLENSPKNSRGQPIVSETGGDTDKPIKSFADFLKAVRRGDTKRLASVYGSYKMADDDDGETKDIGDVSGASGGYLIPTEFSTSLLQITPQSSPILSRVQTIPVSTSSGMWPVLDQYLTPVAGSGQTALAAGVTAPYAASGSAGGTLTEVSPLFEALQWRIHKIGGYTQVDNELMSDSPLAIEALLRALFNVAVSAKHEYYVLRGTGIGQPLGILNSSCIVNVTPSTNNLFSWIDVGQMQSHHKVIGTQTPVWLWHPSLWPDVLTMEVGTAGGAVWTSSMQAAQGNRLNGYEYFQSEHLPQANNSGDVILADLFAYLLFRRQEISIAYSEHAGFLSDQATWRFTARADGMPWLRLPITLADPQGSYTISPFVIHND